MIYLNSVAPLVGIGLCIVAVMVFLVFVAVALPKLRARKLLNFAANPRKIRDWRKQQEKRVYKEDARRYTKEIQRVTVELLDSRYYYATTLNVNVANWFKLQGYGVDALGFSGFKITLPDVSEKELNDLIVK